MKEISYKNTRIEKIAENAEIHVHPYPTGSGWNIDLYLNQEDGKIHLGQLYLTKGSHIVKKAAERKFKEVKRHLLGYITGEVNETDFIEIFHKAKITRGKLSKGLRDAIYKTIKWKKEQGDEPIEPSLSDHMKVI